MAIQLLPISGDDVPAAAEFLHEHLNKRISAAAWAQALRPSWEVDAPNHGFMLVAEKTIVGVHAAYYSQRRIDDKVYRLCNLAAWCVLKDYRLPGFRLLKGLLAQGDYHFTDFSPSGNVVHLNTRLNFERLDTATALVPNLPWPIWSVRTRIVSDRAEIEAVLKGRDLEIYRDHASAAAGRHAVIIHGEEVCYVIFRRDRRKNLPIFASLLHVGNPRLFTRAARQFFRYLLLRHGVLATLAEIRIVGSRPFPSLMLRSTRPKMFKSDSLRPDQIDYLYSELTCVPW